MSLKVSSKMSLSLKADGSCEVFDQACLVALLDFGVPFPFMLVHLVIVFVIRFKTSRVDATNLEGDVVEHDRQEPKQVRELDEQTQYRTHTSGKSKGRNGQQRERGGGDARKAGFSPAIWRSVPSTPPP